MSYLLSLLAAALYSTASASLFRALQRPAPGLLDNAALATGTFETDSAQPRYADRHRQFTFLLAGLAVVIHGWIVIYETGLPHQLSLPLVTSIIATTLIIALLHIFICLRQPADYLGIALYPLAALSLLTSQATDYSKDISGDVIQLHVFLSLLAYAVLAITVAQAILVSIQRRFLSRHKPGGFVRSLPPLDTTEQLLFTLLGAGFILLSLALGSGFVFLEDMFGQRLVHKTVLSCVAWAIFAVLLFGRWQFGWRGKKAVHWTLGGFGILVLAYFGSKVVIEVLLQ